MGARGISKEGKGGVVEAFQVPCGYMLPCQAVLGNVIQVTCSHHCLWAWDPRGRLSGLNRASCLNAAHGESIQETAAHVPPLLSTLCNMLPGQAWPTQRGSDMRAQGGGDRCYSGSNRGNRVAMEGHDRTRTSGSSGKNLGKAGILQASRWKGRCAEAHR